MASVRYSTIVNEIKGKLNGSVWQGGKSGFIVRNCNKSNGKLTKADAGRAFIPKRVLAAASVQWRLLTDAQRTAWNMAAVNFPARNRFNDLYTPSGFQVFVTLNTQVTNLTGIVLTDPPTPVSVPDLAAASFDIPSETEMDIDYPGGVPSDFMLRVEASQPCPVGFQIKASMFRIIKNLASGVSFPFDLASYYEQVFGLFGSGSRIWFRLTLVSTTTGQKGVPQIYFADVP